MNVINIDNIHPWAEEAVEIIKIHKENELRHFQVDSMIEHIQYDFLEKNKSIVPPRRAYSYFFQEKLPKVAMVHKKRGSNEKYQIAKKVAVWWNRLDHNEKKIYYLLEQVDTIRCQNEFQFLRNKTEKMIKSVQDLRGVITEWDSDVITEWIDLYFKRTYF